LNLVSYEVAYRAYLAAKLLAIGGLILIWRRIFQEEMREKLLFVTTLLLGFGATLSMDIEAGNISIFEQLLFWGAVCFLLRKKYLAFASLIVASAIVKLTLIVFLPLVFLSERSWRASLAFALGVSAFLGLHALSYWNEPGLFHGFLGTLADLDFKGDTNPCSLSFFRDLATNLGFPISIGHVAHAIFALSVFCCFLWAVVRFELDQDIRLLVVFACIAFALASPRVKDYSYILLLMPAMMTIRLFANDDRMKALLLLLLWIALLPYQPLAVTFLLFVLSLWGMRQGSAKCRKPRETPHLGSEPRRWARPPTGTSLLAGAASADPRWIRALTRLCYLFGKWSLTPLHTTAKQR
jgi:hypothetical protein